MKDLKPINLEIVQEYRDRLKNDFEPDSMFVKLPYFDTYDINLDLKKRFNV